MTTIDPSQTILQDILAPEQFLIRKAILKLLEIKDSDTRIVNLEQCRDAVDKGLHSGGAFSAVVPLVALFYGGFITVDVVDPTRPGQDMFVLSKGHAVATLASIYADLGYFSTALLKNSRSYESILNGHPGPVLPGVQIATGPMGQGFSVAQGFAIAGRFSPRFDTYCMVGDGELQEGPIWEGVMYAGTRHLDNLCLLVDQNNGQLDLANRMVFPMPDLDAVFKAFGWQTHSVDATQYDGVYASLEHFRSGPRNGKPTAIICHSTKGHGAFSDFLNKHKVAMTANQIEQEMSLQQRQRHHRVQEVKTLFEGIAQHTNGSRLQQSIIAMAKQMHLQAALNLSGELRADPGPVLMKRVPPRKKKIEYNPALLPRIDKTKQYSASDIVTGAMKVFALDPAVVSIDSDLASTSGLEAGIAAVDQNRALNVGVAEANMMCIGEAFAALGYNAWISTFCPFFDWKVLRRVAVGYQERLESIASSNGWLSEGHGLDLTMLATGPNLETRTNGATHMGNDDITVFDGIAHLKIIDVCCPQQLLGVMKWIMEGNKGLVYLRVMRAPSAVIYDDGYEFTFGKAHYLRKSAEDKAVIVTSSRGVHEALMAADLCADRNVPIGVVDMASLDEDLLLDLHRSGILICFAEQNNGYIWQNYLKVLFHHRTATDWSRIVTVNTLDSEHRPQFIHSGTYEELLSAFNLSPKQLSEALLRTVDQKNIS